jgi:hypothetical protein
MATLSKQGEVLTTDSPRWNEFAGLLNEAIYISDTEWRCDGDGGWGPNPHRFRYAKRVMEAMGGIDIPASLAFFKDHGGGCDCEILANVDDV